MTDQTAVEQLLAYEQAREERRLRRNKLVRWAAIVAIIIAAVAVPVWLSAQQRAQERQTEREMYCDMMYGFGSDRFESCVSA